MVSVDIYVNETTSKADLILPGALAAGEVPLRHRALQLRRAQRRQLLPRPVLPKPEGALDEWEIFLRLIGIATGQGSDADVAAIDDFIAREAVRRETGDEHSPVGRARPRGADGGAGAARRRRPAAGPPAARRPLRRRLRRQSPTGSRSTSSIENPHGIDLGPLEPRLPERAAHAERADRPRTRLRASPTSAGFTTALARPSNGLVLHRPPAPALQQLLDAQPAAAGAGAAALHAARPSRATPSASAWPTARRRSSRRARARFRRRSR